MADYGGRELVKLSRICVSAAAYVGEQKLNRKRLLLSTHCVIHTQTVARRWP
jgi:hypothetical protein